MSERGVARMYASRVKNFRCLSIFYTIFYTPYLLAYYILYINF